MAKAKYRSKLCCEAEINLSRVKICNLKHLVQELGYLRMGYEKKKKKGKET